MKQLMLIASLLFGASAFASEQVTVNFSYFGNQGMNRSFYACSYVEDMAESHLKAMGATYVDARCSGGIQPWGSMQPISLRVTFQKPVVVGNTTETVRIEGDTWNPACDLNARMIKEFLKKFDNIKVLKKSDSCAFHNSNYFFELEVTK